MDLHKVFRNAWNAALRNKKLMSDPKKREQRKTGRIKIGIYNKVEVKAKINLMVDAYNCNCHRQFPENISNHKL